MQDTGFDDDLLVKLAGTAVGICGHVTCHTFTTKRCWNFFDVCICTYSSACDFQLMASVCAQSNALVEHFSVNTVWLLHLDLSACLLIIRECSQPISTHLM